MRYIIFLIFILLVFILFSISEDRLSKKNKFIILGFFIIIGIAGFFLEKNSSMRYERFDILSREFEQGKKIDCNGVKIDKESFEISFPTSTFIAKRDAKKEFTGMIIPFKDCKVDDDK